MIVERRKPLTARVGVVAVGHHTCWEQFAGLLDELMGKVDAFVDRLRGHRVEVETFGMVDRAAAAYAALPGIKAADLDLLFVDMVTYATRDPPTTSPWGSAAAPGNWSASLSCWGSKRQWSRRRSSPGLDEGADSGEWMGVSAVGHRLHSPG